MMNSMIRRTVLVAMAVVLCICLRMSYTAYAADPKGYEVMAESERLALLVNKSTTEIAVRDKLTGEIWYSNPPSAKQEKYQLNIVYYDPEDKRKRYDSYKDSIQHGQFEIEPIENGVAITYTLGLVWKEDDFIPLSISQERFQSMILDKLDKSDQSFILKQYDLVQLSRLPEPDTSGTLGPDKLWGKYELVPLSSTMNTTQKNNLVYLMLDRMVDLRDDVDARADVKEEYMINLVDNPTYVLKSRITPWDKVDMVNLFKSIGYLPEDVGVDQEAYGYPAPERNIETFDITIEYTLEDDCLIVTVPMDRVRYPKDVVAQMAYVKGAESVFQGQVGRSNIYEHFEQQVGGNLVTFPLYSVDVLPFFGAADKGTQGYIFVPDGSGALIDISTLSDRSYLKRVFGRDYVIPQQTSSTDIVQYDSSQGIHLPVFGLKKNDLAFFAVIESGAAFASVSGRVAGNANTYSSVSSEYTLMPFSVVTLATTARSERGGDKSINIYAERLPEEDIRIRYAFLDRDSADYVGMARYYQQYLVERGILQRRTTEGDPPLFLDILGAIYTRRPIMGVPLNVPVALTTFDEARQIVDELMAAGVKDIVVKYSGWLKGGIDHDFASRAMTEDVLGGLKGLTRLRDYLSERGVELYPSVYLQLLPTLNTSSVNLRREAAKVPTGQVAETHILSPRRLEILVSNFLKDYLGYGIPGVALDDLGYIVVSDYQPGNMTDRGQAAQIVESQLKRLREEAGLDLMTTLTNVYALPYAKYMVHMSLEATQYRSVAESVPFMQMVVRGYNTYAGTAINVSDNIRKLILRSIETGAHPQFRWFYREPSIIKDTTFADLYSCHYQYWLSEAVDIYLELKEFLSKVKDQRIVDHKRLAADVYQTVYENGVSVIVNYRSDPFEFDGVAIDGASYRVIEGGQSGAH